MYLSTLLFHYWHVHPVLLSLRNLAEVNIKSIEFYSGLNLFWDRWSSFFLKKKKSIEVYHGAVWEYLDGIHTLPQNLQQMRYATWKHLAPPWLFWWLMTIWSSELITFAKFEKKKILMIQTMLHRFVHLEIAYGHQEIGSWLQPSSR